MTSSFSKLKTIRKAYPPQFTVNNNQIYTYCPLQHWIERHSSTSLEEIIQIESPTTSFYMNNIEGEIILQNQSQIFVKSNVQSQFCKFTKKYSSEKTIGSNTLKIKGQFINFNEDRSLNIWKNQDDYYKVRQDDFNPQNVKKTQTVNNNQHSSSLVDTYINSETLLKNTTNGFDLTQIFANDDSLLTLHKVQNTEQSYVRIFSTELNGSNPVAQPIRAYLPRNIKSLLCQNKNQIFAFGGNNLLMIDKRTQQTVANLNDLTQSSINCLQKHQQKPHWMYFSRDRTVLLQDIRMPSLIMEVVCTFDENIESFKIIKQNHRQVYCFTSEFVNGVSLFQKIQ